MLLSPCAPPPLPAFLLLLSVPFSSSCCSSLLRSPPPAPPFFLFLLLLSPPAFLSPPAPRLFSFSFSCFSFSSPPLVRKSPRAGVVCIVDARALVCVCVCMCMRERWEKAVKARRQHLHDLKTSQLKASLTTPEQQREEIKHWASTETIQRGSRGTRTDWLKSLGTGALSVCMWVCAGVSWSSPRCHTLRAEWNKKPERNERAEHEPVRARVFARVRACARLLGLCVWARGFHTVQLYVTMEVGFPYRRETKEDTYVHTRTHNYPPPKAHSLLHDSDSRFWLHEADDILLTTCVFFHLEEGRGACSSPPLYSPVLLCEMGRGYEMCPRGGAAQLPSLQLPYLVREHAGSHTLTHTHTCLSLKNLTSEMIQPALLPSISPSSSTLLLSHSTRTQTHTQLCIPVFKGTLFPLAAL